MIRDFIIEETKKIGNTFYSNENRKLEKAEQLLLTDLTQKRKFMKFKTKLRILEKANKLIKVYFISFILFLTSCRTIDVYTEVGQNESIFVDFKETIILTGNTILPESPEVSNRKPSVLLIIPAKNNKVKYNDYNFQSEISKILMWSRKYKKITLTTSEFQQIEKYDLIFYLSIFTERKKYIDRYRPIDLKNQTKFVEEVNLNIIIEENKIKRKIERTRTIVLHCIDCEEEEREALKNIYQEIGRFTF